jgi:uncharacterized surface protein with fasciclin (FAS1) repeats
MSIPEGGIMRKHRFGPLAAALAAAALAGCAVAGVAVARDSDPPQGCSSKNLVETAVAAGNFTTLVSLVQQAGLADTLATGGPFTVFAPTDEAFAHVPKETLAALGANPGLLKSVLLYHVAAGRLDADDVVERNRIRTLNGEKLRVRAKRDFVKVNDARVLTADVNASNGVIHVIDRVLIPPTGNYRDYDRHHGARDDD